MLKLRQNKRPWGLAVLMTMSFSGALAIAMAFVARLLMLALGLDLLLKVLGS